MRPTQRRAPGVPDDSPVVHDEIKQLATDAKRAIQKNYSRHATNESQILAGLEQFGPSGQSKAMLTKEEEAAEMSMGTGIYVVYRNEAPKSASASSDFCTRVGPSHKCFCGHSLADHGQPKKTRRGLEAPLCNACGCRGFMYVPNEPEEVGDHWISRRAGFVPGTWSPSCRCNHRAWEHDPVTKKCRKCTGCFRYDGHHSCIVCEGHAQDHFTIFECAQDRIDARRPVHEEYFPLSKRGEEQFRQVVLGERRQLMHQQQNERAMIGIAKNPMICGNCNSPYRSSSSKFCSNCGSGRQYN